MGSCENVSGHSIFPVMFHAAEEQTYIIISDCKLKLCKPQHKSTKLMNYQTVELTLINTPAQSIFEVDIH